jgi:hypothetical protein
VTTKLHPEYIQPSSAVRDSQDLFTTWEDNIEKYLRKIDGVLWTGLIWLRIGTSGGLLLTQ